MTIKTWTDENAVIYWHDDGWRAGRDVFEIQEALNERLFEDGYDLELTAMDILEGTRYLYVTLETMLKETWPADEVFAFPELGLVPVGTIQLEDIE